MELYAHQRVTADFLARTPRAFVTSDPGTGKTASALEGYRKKKEGKMLVLAPLSILGPSWGEDIEKFTQFSYNIAHGNPDKRVAIMESGVNVVISNHDAVKWIAKNPKVLDQFSHLVIDEFTAFKNRTSQRSKALKVITSRIPNVWMMSGTPNSNTILDIWYPAFLLDNGQRLGRTYWQFRSQVCEPVQVGPQITHIKWQDKPGIEADVADLLKDITIRFKFEDCIDIPEHKVSTLTLEMPKWLDDQYNHFLKHAYLETESGVLTAPHAGALAKKALQILSGAVYNSDGTAMRVHEERYDLITSLVAEREQCLVAFNYTHEKLALCEKAEKAGFTYAVIDGSVPRKKRQEIVTAFQAGEIKVIYAHPQTASHGLTLTRGTTTIWASPTYNAEWYQQFIKRIYRAGQKRKTETIRIAYGKSKEIDVYQKLDGKILRMDDLLDLFQLFSQAA